MSNPERPVRRKLPLDEKERTVDKAIKQKEQELLQIGVNLTNANRALDAYTNQRAIDYGHLAELQKHVQNLAAQFDTCNNELEELFRISREKMRRGSRMIH